MKKILLSIITIGAVAAIAIGASVSYFSDTETSSGNIFTAGSLDLKVDHLFASYNGNDCGEECVPEPTNLLATIGFETPEVTNTAKWQIFPSPVGGWTVEWYDGATSYGGLTRPEPANLEYHEGVLGSAFEGDQYVELDTDWFGPSSSQSGEPASVKIYQVITTTPGKKYLLKFAFAPRPNTPASDNKLEVKWDGGVVATIGPVAGPGGPINWTVYSYDVIASGSTTRLEFTDLGIPNSLGTFIDDIQLYEYTCDYQIPGGTCNLWGLKDLEEGDYFWNFTDVKPGDWGINIISLHAFDNDAFACLFTSDIEDQEITVNEPEIAAGDDIASIIGELSQFIKIFVWEDADENNAYDTGETILVPVNSALSTATLTIALTESNTKNIGLAWCAGTQSLSGSDILCDGSSMGNIAQTDKVIAALTAYAEQQRNNSNFVCPAAQQSPRVGANLSLYQGPETCDVTVDGGTIQDGIDGANPGETVCVADGTYNESVIISKPLTLASIGGAENTATINGGVSITASDVTVKGFKIIPGYFPGTYTGFYLATNGVGNIVISDNDIDGTSQGNTDRGIETLYNGTFGAITIINNKIHGVVTGIYENPHTGTAFEIKYNDIFDTTAGIGGFNHSIVTYNEFKSPGSEAMGTDSSYLDGVANYNNFLDGTRINDYGATLIISAENNFFNLGGVNQTTPGKVDFTPETLSQYPHN